MKLVQLFKKIKIGCKNLFEIQCQHRVQPHQSGYD